MTTTTAKLVITGAPRKFDQVELSKRQQQYRNMYQQTSKSCVTVRGSHPKEFYQSLIDHGALGYTLTDYPGSNEPMNYSLLMRKPELLQEEDLITIDSEVKDKYVQELQAEYDDYKEQLTKQLLQKEQLKKEKAEADAQAKLFAKVKAEVEGCYVPLVIPD
ncbi:hypothetical protein [Pseudomonas taetrolens]|uniref:hypothetical protein n=1 Tax=Pseudomonas taetrolens TaxID=47884 RepID=UPI003F9880FE